MKQSQLSWRISCRHLLGALCVLWIVMIQCDRYGIHGLGPTLLFLYANAVLLVTGLVVGIREIFDPRTHVFSRTFDALSLLAICVASGSLLVWTIIEPYDSL